MRATLFAAVCLLAVGVLIPREALADGSGNSHPWGAKVVLTGGGGRPVPGWSHSPSVSRWHYPAYRYWHPYQSAYWAEPVVTPIAPTETARVMNPAANGVNLTFSINDRRFSLAPGMQQDVNVVPGSYVEFDRGAGRGLVRYSLDGAKYTFTPTQNGWELYRAPFDLPTNIASGNPPAPPVTPEAAQSPLPAASAPRPIQR